MSRNNRGNNKQRNYFTGEIQRFGENFLAMKNSEQLRRDVIRIFRELCRGKIDINEYSKYLTEQQLVDVAIFESYSKMVFYTKSYFGAKMLMEMEVMNGIQDPNTINVMSTHNKSMEAYSLIHTTFNNIKMTGSVEHLYTMIGQLRSYSDYI